MILLASMEEGQNKDRHSASTNHGVGKNGQGRSGVSLEDRNTDNSAALQDDDYNTRTVIENQVPSSTN
jgi:hypothetical protein